ncbi:hypothetical protein QJS04_geneDACA002021 [Acorus gramineus]|uniref:F-box domain-containing protein n=1 Tax=Acorus gramineus TaxID=55184 RepID=A0AAV9AAC7_ACOGR|nr:hypothetical protein QJS04_geneDACA002021 [Acorus gramineus]
MKQLHQEKLQKARSAIKNRRTALFQRHTKGQEHPFLQPPPPPPPQELPPPPPPKTTRPWSKLPLPFVKHLLRRLQIPDYIRFSSVCHAWHISKKRAQTLPSQQLPWLLLARHVEDPSLTFYSLSEDRFYCLAFPNIIGSECVSAVRGWLLFEPNLSAMPTTVSRLLLNPLLDILHEFPNNSLVPPIISAAAIIDSPSPNNPQGFWVFFAGGRSILFWNPVENVKFRKVIDHDEFWLEILDMTAEGEKLYYITDDLDLFEYNHRSNSTKPLIQNHHGDYPAQPSVENNHFLMVARVGEERKDGQEAKKPGRPPPSPITRATTVTNARNQASPTLSITTDRPGKVEILVTNDWLVAEESLFCEL